MLAILSILSLAACGDGSKEGVAQNDEQMTLDYSDIVASDYVISVTYTGFDVGLENPEALKEEALWKKILESAETADMPEEKARYYFEQTKKYYLYFAGDIEEDYEYVLKHFGTDERKMMEEAKALVRKDIIYLYIVEAEKISLTEQEKTANFEKYVDKFVFDYGYKREYVIENMTEMIYDSMLYDKTMEYLIARNTFTVLNKK